MGIGPARDALIVFSLLSAYWIGGTGIFLGAIWLCRKWRNRQQPGKHPGHRNDGQQSGEYWDLEWSHPMADPRYFGEGP